MPALPSPRQPAADIRDWFLTPAGRAILASEEVMVAQALADRPGLPWLWCGPDPGEEAIDGALGRGLRLSPAGDGWRGAVECALPLPLPSESFGAVVLQHVVRPAGAQGPALLDEAARLLVPGGRLWLFLLNPLAPYRWRWRGTGISAAEPLVWRRRLRTAGLMPEAVSQGLGPSWSPRVSPQTQQGPGLRAAYLLRAEKRSLPLTPVRRRALQLAPAA
ncbi:MAG: methyltransferase domain-containing protein [Luteimonas sp.]|nr:methyltransferase domain-containing protein [Luteimonas sp.]